MVLFGFVAQGSFRGATKLRIFAGGAGGLAHGHRLEVWVQLHRGGATRYGGVENVGVQGCMAAFVVRNISGGCVVKCVAIRCRGYLWERFIGGWILAAHEERVEARLAQQVLGASADWVAVQCEITSERGIFHKPDLTHYLHIIVTPNIAHSNSNINTV